MNTKTKIIISTLVLACIFFYAGIKYNQAHASVTPAAFQAGSRRTFAGTRGGGLTAGMIASKDAQSITLSIPGGGSKIIFVASSTKISKSVPASLDDLTVGQNVSVTGTPDSDGSLTASSIDLRPAPVTNQ